MQRKIGIVVVSYHNPDMTTRYVTTELPKLTTPYTLVVVNVAATKEDSIKLADACGLCFRDDVESPTVAKAKGYLIWRPDNLGYAKGNNEGVRFLNSIGEFSHFVFSNDDIEIRDTNILDVLSEKMSEYDDVACIGPRIVGIDGHDQSPHDRYISPYRLIGWRLFPFLRKRKDPSPQSENITPSSRYTYWVCGAFMMVEAKEFLKIDMFDENTFLYYEEAILAERLIMNGKKVFFEPSVEVVHYEGGSSMNSNKIKRMHERNSRSYYFKEYKHINPIMIGLCYYIYQ